MVLLNHGTHINREAGTQEHKKTTEFNTAVSLNFFSCLTDFCKHSCICQQQQSQRKGWDCGDPEFSSKLSLTRSKKHLKYIQMNTLFQTIREKFDITYFRHHILYFANMLFFSICPVVSSQHCNFFFFFNSQRMVLAMLIAHSQRSCHDNQGLCQHRSLFFFWKSICCRKLIV